MKWFLYFVTRRRVAAISLAPFGIYFDDLDLAPYQGNMADHEKIHWRQQLEMLIILFYLWYLIEWILKLFKYGRESYYNISFEREAYKKEADPNYLGTRKPYSWIKYL